VAYRKPPDVQFPAGLEDAMKAWRWALEQCPASAVAVAGDSSGGNLAFALMVKLAQLEEPQPAACIGISPWLNLNRPQWTGAWGKLCVELYLGGKRKVTAASDPLVSPVNMKPELLQRCAPVLMHAGRNELTTEDVKAMQAAFEREGIFTEVQLYGAPHIFQVGPGFWNSTKDSLSRINAFLERHWS